MTLLQAEGCVFGFGGVIIGLLVTAMNYDRPVSWLIYLCHVPVFPEARAIAWLIYDLPDEWNGDGYRLSHPTVGSIWIANAAYGLKLETPFGHWTPNAIERRIIRDAVDWRLREYIRGRLGQALRQPVLGRR